MPPRELEASQAKPMALRGRGEKALECVGGRRDLAIPQVQTALLGDLREPAAGTQGDDRYAAGHGLEESEGIDGRFAGDEEGVEAVEPRDDVVLLPDEANPLADSPLGRMTLETLARRAVADEDRLAGRPSRRQLGHDVHEQLHALRLHEPADEADGRRRRPGWQSVENRDADCVRDDRDPRLAEAAGDHGTRHPVRQRHKARVAAPVQAIDRPESRGAVENAGEMLRVHHRRSRQRGQRRQVCPDRRRVEVQDRRPRAAQEVAEPPQPDRAATGVHAEANGEPLVHQRVTDGPSPVEEAHPMSAQALLVGPPGNRRHLALNAADMA